MNNQVLSGKVTVLFNSIRFWQLSFAAVFLLLAHYFPGMEFLWNTLAAYLAAVTGIGTLDSVASRFAGTKV